MDGTNIGWTWIKVADGIERKGATWNPVTGCRKVSTGCKNCYAESLWPRLAGTQNTVYSGRKFTDVQFHAERLGAPLRWSHPRGIFVNSLSDLFHENVSDCQIDQIFAVMALADRHIYQILTKRAKRMRDYMRGFSWDRVLQSCRGENGVSVIPGYSMQALWYAFGKFADAPVKSMPRKDLWPLPNVWMLVSVENQETADERVPYLIDTPAHVRGVSAEPLLGPVDFGKWLPERQANWQCHTCGGFQRTFSACLHCGGEADMLSGSHAANKRTEDGWENRQPIDWIVTGGESGSATRARPTHEAWPRAIQAQCARAGVSYYHKQQGAWAPCPPDEWHGMGPQGSPRQLVVSPTGETAGGFIGKAFALEREAEGWRPMQFVGKGKAGRLLDGREYSEFPRIPHPSALRQTNKETA